MEIHIGTSSKLSKFISNKSPSIIRFSSKKENNSKKINYRNLSFLKKLKNKNQIKYYIFFLGKNFKGKKKEKSYYVNYFLPLKILNYLIQYEKKKLRIIFFGTFLENEKITSKENLDYKKHKIALRKKIINLSNSKKFEFIWLKLPLIYGQSIRNKSFVNNLINDLKLNNKINIQFKYNTIHLLHIQDLNKLISKVKSNWKKYKNKIIIPKTEGPYYLFEFIEKIKKFIKYENRVNYINKRKKKKLIPNINFTEIVLKKNLVNFFKKIV